MHTTELTFSIALIKKNCQMQVGALRAIANVGLGMFKKKGQIACNNLQA
jgi:hypothetical protein